MKTKIYIGFTVLFFVLSISMVSAYSTTALYTKETFTKDFSPSIQNRVWVNNCVTFNNTTSSCELWDNQSSCESRTYIFDTDNEVVSSNKSTPFNLAENVTIKARFKRTPLTSIAITHLEPNDKTTNFNQDYCYERRDITSQELSDLKIEIPDIFIHETKGKIKYKNVTKLDLLTKTSFDVSMNLSLESELNNKRVFKAKFGNHSLNWTVTSQADWQSATRVNVNTTQVVGSVVLNETGTIIDDFEDTDFTDWSSSALWNRNTSYAKHGDYSGTYTFSAGSGWTRKNLELSGTWKVVMWFYDDLNTWGRRLIVKTNVLTEGPIQLYVGKYEGASGVSGYYVHYEDTLPAWTSTGVAYSAGWHNVTFISNASAGMKYYFDGVYLGNLTTTYIQYVGLNINVTTTVDFLNKGDFSYSSSGTLISQIFDTGAVYTFKNLTINGTFPTSTSVLVGLNYSTDNSTWTVHSETANNTSNSTWDFSDFNAQYVKFNLTLQTPNNSLTPQVDSVVVYYDNILGSAPSNFTVASNVTYARNGTYINVTTSNASDPDGSTYSLKVGSTPTDYIWCNTDFVTNGTQPFCVFVFNFTDNAVHTFYARLEDNTTRNSTNQTFDITADNTPPALSLYSPTSANFTNSSLIGNLSYKVTDDSAVGTVQYHIWGVTNASYSQLNITTTSNGTFNVTQEGQYRFMLTANDTSGNFNNTTNVTFFFDWIPVITNESVSNSAPGLGDMVNLSAIITDNFTSVKSARVRVAMPSGAINTYALIQKTGQDVWYYSVFSASQYGTYTAVFYAYDQSTTEEGNSGSVTFTVPNPSTGGSSGGGGGGGGGTTIVVVNATPTPQGALATGILKLQYGGLESSLVILPWEGNPKWKFSVASYGVDLESCEGENGISCEVITPTRLVLRYQPPTLAWNQFIQEVRANITAYGAQNNLTAQPVAAMPLKIIIKNYGVYAPLDMGSAFSGGNILFKIENGKIKGVLLYWLAITLFAVPLAIIYIFRRKNKKNERRSAYRRSLGHST